MKKSLIIFFCFTMLACNSELYAQRFKSTEKEFVVDKGNTLDAIVKGDFGKLAVRRGSGNKGVVFADYDQSLFNFDFFFDNEFNEVFVTLKKERLLDGLDNLDDSATLDLQFPVDIPTNLDITFKGGEIELELGGISLKNFILDSWAGSAVVDFGRKNPSVMEYMKIDVNIGEVRLENLGNANFRDAYIDGGIGELRVDMLGDYEKGDHNVLIDLDIGEAEIVLPDDIGLRVHVSKWPLVSVLSMDRELDKKGKYYYSRGFDTAETKLFVKIELGMGECRVRLR